jgi:hypothetical protein
MLNNTDKELPHELLSCLEELNKGNDEAASNHFKVLSKKTSILSSYAIDALAYFIKPLPIPISFIAPSTQKEVDQVNQRAVSFIIKWWNLEVEKPWLALKGYCLTSNTEGVRKIIDKVKPEEIMNNKALTGEPLLADSSSVDNAAITEILLEKKAWKGTSALRIGLRKAAGLNNVNVLEKILTKVPPKELDPTILRDSLLQSMIGKSIECYKKICQFADLGLLEIWVNQIKAMQKQHERDPVSPSYKEELKIITNEISKRKLINHFNDKSKNNQLQALTIS